MFLGMSKSHSLWLLTTSPQSTGMKCAEEPNASSGFPSSTDKSAASGNLSFSVNLVDPTP